MTGYQPTIEVITAFGAVKIYPGRMYTDIKKAKKELNRTYQKMYRDMKKDDYKYTFRRRIQERELTPELIKFFQSINKPVIF